MIFLLPKLSSFKKKKVLILAHSRADVDAFAASAALFLALKKHNYVMIGIPDHISSSAKQFAEKLKIPFSINPNTKHFDTLFFVDFNSENMLGSMKEDALRFKGKTFLIDHHTKNRQMLSSAKNSLIDASKIASCEIIFELIKKSKMQISKEIAICICAGIIEDSAHFLTADETTFPIMAECLEKSEKDFHEILFLAKAPFDKGKKIALLKAAERLKIFEAGDFLIVSSQLGSFEGEAATSLVTNGADIAFVGNSEKGILKISGRAGHSIIKKTGIDLARHVFQKLPEFYGGNGGGHASAAAFTGKSGSIEEPLQKCIELTLEFLKTKNPEIELKKI